MNLKRALNLALTLAVITALAMSNVVWADNVVNNLDNSVETATIPAGGSVKVGFYIDPTTGGGDAGGCNATGDKPAYLTITPPAGVTVSPTSIQFIGCGNVKEVTFSSNTPGTYEISNFSMTGGREGSKWNFEPAKFTIKVQAADTTPPVITPNITGTAGANDWYTSDVTVSWTVVDNESAITSTSGCNTTEIIEDTAETTLTCTATSAGGTASESVTIKRDATPPTITAELDKSPDEDTGWYNQSTGAPTVSFACSDNLSGVKYCPASHTFGEGENQSHSATATDNAGNSASAGVSDIDVDLTAPTITASISPDRPESGWWNTASGAPTVSFACSDNLSGVKYCPASHTFGEGKDQSDTRTVYDNAGNSASAGVSDIDVDLTAPTITASISPVRPASGWWNIASGAPTVSFTCEDATSGVQSCPASHSFGEGENQSHSATVTDNAGNSASAGVSDIDVDLNPPAIVWNGGPANGASYYFGSVPDAPTCTAQDTLSGPAGCTVSGYSTVVGTHTITATAADVAGNTANETRTYTVQPWKLYGFYQPVDMSTPTKLVYNTVKGGATVPLKFEIFAATELTDTASVKSLTTVQTACDANAISDEIETLATGGTSLRYDWTAGQFIFNWKTPTTAGKCYRVTMTTQDGSFLQAYFKIK